MPIFSKDNKNILFIHVPKSAGSSIEKIGSDLGWSESFSVRGKALKDLEYYKASLQHLHAESLELLLNLDKFDSIFTVVRNPFSRFKSEYYWQRSQRITNLDVDEWISDTLEKYSKDHYIYDNHIRPQVEFLPDHDNLKVFKLEESGVERAKDIFLSFSSGGGKSWKKLFFSKSIPYRQEKRSVKDPDIEVKFLDFYKEIVDFYEEDFLAFSYNT